MEPSTPLLYSDDGSPTKPMKVTAERIPEAQLVLEVELDDERLKKSLDQASRRLAQRYRIPGFRKGKAPRAVVEQALGADRVFDEAIERLIPAAYEEAIEQEGVEAIGPPQFEIVDREPIRFKATIPLEPKIDLADYRAISAEKESIDVTDETIAETILEIRRRNAVLEPVERPAEFNDRVRLDIRAEVDGKTALREDGAEVSLREGVPIGVPGVVEKIVGLEKGPEHDFTIDVADDWDDEEVAGKTVTFFVTIHDIKQEILPDPDDDLATEVGDFETFEDLRSRIRDDLVETAERRATETHHQELLEKVTAAASVEFPPMLIDHEIEHMMAEVARQAGQDLETYFQEHRAEADAMRQAVRPQAAERVLRSLILNEVGRVEEVSVSDADVADEITRMIGDNPQAEQMQAIFDTENSRDAIRRNLHTTKTLGVLAEISAANLARSDDVDSAKSEAEDESPDDESAE